MTTGDDAGCLFCAIVAGRSPASVVAEDDRTIAVLDLYPVTDGHTLVLTKRHAVGLADLDPDDGRAVFAMAQRVAAMLRGGAVPCEGINLFLADGKVAFQEIFHVHLHVLPRHRDDTFRIDADWSHRPSRADLDDLASRLRAADAASA